jgi:hypothetical protein
MKSSCHSLVPFLPLFCSCQFQRLDSIQLQAPKLISWQAGILKLDSSPSTTVLYSYCFSHYSRDLCPFITNRYKPHRKHPRNVKEVCLLVHYVAMDVLLSLTHAAGMCLLSRCLVMGIHATIFSNLMLKIRHFIYTPLPFSTGISVG